MKKRNLIIVIVLIILLIIGAIMAVKKYSKGEEIKSDIDINDITPDPVGPYVYDGTKDLYLENKTEKEIEKIIVIAYGEDNSVLSTTEVIGDDLEEDEDKIVTVTIPDDENAKWDLTIIIDGTEYKAESLFDEKTFYDQALVPFNIENNKIVIDYDE